MEEGWRARKQVPRQPFPSCPHAASSPCLGCWGACPRCWGVCMFCVPVWNWPLIRISKLRFSLIAFVLSEPFPIQEGTLSTKSQLSSNAGKRRTQPVSTSHSKARRTGTPWKPPFWLVVQTTKAGPWPRLALTEPRMSLSPTPAGAVQPGGESFILARTKPSLLSPIHSLQGVLSPTGSTASRGRISGCS